MLFLRQPRSEDKQISRGVAASEVVPISHFQIRLFEQRTPQLAFGRVSSQHVVVVVHREEVVDCHSSPQPVHVQFDDILSEWIVYWVPVLVLRVDVAGDKSLFVIHFTFHMSCKGQTSDDRTITH